jgi:hypothetical protein
MGGKGVAVAVAVAVGVLVFVGVEDLKISFTPCGITEQLRINTRATIRMR